MIAARSARRSDALFRAFQSYIIHHKSYIDRHVRTPGTNDGPLPPASRPFCLGNFRPWRSSQGGMKHPGALVALVLVLAATALPAQETASEPIIELPKFVVTDSRE